MSKKKENPKVDLALICEYIADNAYDYSHGLGPTIEWEISATGLLDFLAERCNIKKKTIGKLIDKIQDSKNKSC